jgi:transposase
MKYTAEQMVEAIRGSGGIVRLIAARLRCGRSTVYRYARRYPRVREALEGEREVLLDLAESRLLECVERGDLDALIFLLKTLGKDRGYTTRIDVGAAVRRELEELIGDLRRGLNPADFGKVMRIVRKRSHRAA